MHGYVYVLRSELRGRFYVGSTNDLQRRLFEHEAGQESATKGFLPISLVSFKKFDTLIEARREERKIKAMKSRKYIENLIKNWGCSSFG